GQRIQQARQVGIPAGGGDGVVERQIVLHEFLDGGVLAQFAQRGSQLIECLLADAVHREDRRRRFQGPAHLEDLQHRGVLVQVHHEAHRLQQQLRTQAGHIGAVAAAHVQHADPRQRLHRLAQGVAGQAEPLTELLLRGETLPGAELAGDDHLLDRCDRYIGDCHAFILPSSVPLGAWSPSTAPMSRARWARLLPVEVIARYRTNYIHPMFSRVQGGRMKLARLGPAGAEVPVLLTDGSAFDLRPIVSDATARQEHYLSPSALSEIRQAHADGRLEPFAQAEQARIGAAIPRPGSVLCIGQNYAAHAAESGAEPPEVPILFFKPANTVTGPDDPVAIPRNSSKTDWEVELGVVIGSRALYLDSP